MLWGILVWFAIGPNCNSYGIEHATGNCPKICRDSLVYRGNANFHKALALHLTERYRNCCSFHRRSRGRRRGGLGSDPAISEGEIPMRPIATLLCAGMLVAPVASAN